MKKSQWLLLIILIVLIAAYYILKKNEPVEKEVRFFKADSSDIARMEFISTEDTIIVVKNGNEWKLQYPVVWGANETQVEAFFSKVLPIKTSSTPMSEDPGLQKMYKVDEVSGLQVKIYDKKDNLLDRVYIGNGGNSTLDYGRRHSENSIYQFNTNITAFVTPDIFQWRSPNIINLKREQISRIDVTYSKNSYTLTVDADSIRYSDKREAFTILPYNRAQYKVINALENLRTYQFVEKNTAQYAKAFQNPVCKIVLQLKDGKTKTLTCIRNENKLAEPFPNSPDREVIIYMMIDDDMSILYQMSGDFVNRFTRASAHFKTEYD